MKILVTGATGFIGSHLIPVLLRKGVQVVAASRDPERAAWLPWADRVEWRTLDVFNMPDDPYAALGEPDRMVHLAWHGLPDYRGAFHLERNLPADKVFLSAMLEGGLRHLLVAGTCFEYGMQEGELAEDTPTQPDNPYGLAKDRLREHLAGEAAGCGAVFQWARLFYMYGEGQGERSLFTLLNKAIDEGASVFDMSGGQQIRDFLPVKAVAECLAAIALQSEVTGVINICSGRQVTLETLVREYLAERGAAMQLNLGVYPYPDWEPYRFWGNNAKLRSISEKLPVGS